MRTQFVEKVSKSIIKQLLDDILEDDIVNEGEKDSILEDNPNNADRARSLIDTVKKKGDKASEKLIAHIKKRDPTLYDELCLSSPPAAPQIEQQHRTPPIPATDSFWKSKLSDGHVYPVSKDSIKNRVALLITNIEFTVKRLNRNGALKDEENMEKLLKSLEYEVVKHRNLTAKEIDAALIEFSKRPKLKDTDSAVVVIMSHGKLGFIHGVEWKDGDEKPDEFPINNIYKHLGSEGCPALLNKPKIIIIQACRGGEGGAALICDGANLTVLSDEVEPADLPLCAGGENLEEDTLRIVHKEKDSIYFLSCTPDTVSYRDPVSGSLLIQILVEQLNKFAHEDDIEEVFRKVMHRFEELPISNKRQMPTKDRCTLTKRFYFFPDT